MRQSPDSKPRQRKNRRNKFARYAGALLFSGILGVCSGMIGCRDNSANSNPPRSQDHQGQIALGEDGVHYDMNKFIVKFKDDVGEARISGVATELGGTAGTHLKHFNVVGVEIRGDVDKAIAHANKQQEVEMALRNEYLFESMTSWDNNAYDADAFESTNYDDLWWSRQIQLSTALDLIESSHVRLQPVTVAVIESGGFNDLQDKIEIPYVNARYHFDFGEWDVNVSADEEDTHGSAVASLIAAKNNGKYINGVATTINNETIVQILPIKYHSDQVIDLIKNLGNTLSVLSSLNHVLEVAQETNTKVVNMSFGGSLDVVRKGILSVLFSGPIQKLNENGIIVVAGAGNANEDACNNFPSSLEGIIAVGGTGFLDSLDTERRWWTDDSEASNYSTNQDCLTIAAPGRGILTFDGTGIMPATGTSFAAPQVSGLVALIKAINPEATFDEAVALIRDNGDLIILDDDPNPLVQDHVWKRINIRKTMEQMIAQPNSGPLCTEFPDGHENRFAINVNHNVHGCGEGFDLNLGEIFEDGRAELVVHRGFSEFYTLTFGVPQTIELPNLGETALELCGVSQAPCSFGDDNCYVVLSGDKRTVCE
jgi:subtilisin family serine protease